MDEPDGSSDSILNHKPLWATYGSKLGKKMVLQAPHGDLLACMEMAKVADLIAFVASASSLCEENTSSHIDSFGNQCLSMFRSLGLPSIVVLIRDLPFDSKKRQDSKKMCISSLASEFP